MWSLRMWLTALAIGINPLTEGCGTDEEADTDAYWGVKIVDVVDHTLVTGADE